MRFIDWMLQSACLNADPEIFDNDENALYPPKQAIDYCEKCPVKAECLAAHKNDQYGIWGGTTAHQRRQLRREQHRVRCPACTSTAVVKTHENGLAQEICLTCGISWRTTANC